MQEPLGSFDRLHEPRRSFWALAIIIFVLIVFGIFWYIEDAKVSMSQAPTPLQTSPTARIDNLQAAVIYSEIPDFASQF